MAQQLAAYAIVALAALYAAWKLMPGALRVHLAGAVVRRVRRGGRLSDRASADLGRRLTASGCGSCDSCEACTPAPAEFVVRVERRELG